MGNEKEQEALNEGDSKLAIFSNEKMGGINIIERKPNPFFLNYFSENSIFKFVQMAGCVNWTFGVWTNFEVHLLLGLPYFPLQNGRMSK